MMLPRPAFWFMWQSLLFTYLFGIGYRGALFNTFGAWLILNSIVSVWAWLRRP